MIVDLWFVICEWTIFKFRGQETPEAEAFFHVCCFFPSLFGSSDMTFQLMLTTNGNQNPVLTFGA